MADAATPQASALEQPRFWTLDRVADALGDGPRGTAALVRIATDTRGVGAGDCPQSRTTLPASSATTGEKASADPPPITK